MGEHLKRLGSAAVLLALMGGGSAAQQPPDEAKKARCFQLAGVADRYLMRRGEGSGGPDMVVLGARIDCEKGRYDQGIRALEKELSGQRIPIPPPPG